MVAVRGKGIRAYGCVSLYGARPENRSSSDNAKPCTMRYMLFVYRWCGVCHNSRVACLWLSPLCLRSQVVGGWVLRTRVPHAWCGVLMGDFGVVAVLLPPLFYDLLRIYLPASRVVFSLARSVMPRGRKYYSRREEKRLIQQRMGRFSSAKNTNISELWNATTGESNHTP